MFQPQLNDDGCLKKCQSDSQTLIHMYFTAYVLISCESRKTEGCIWRRLLILGYNFNTFKFHTSCGLGNELTRGLDFIDILQQLLSLVDDIEGEVVHGQGLISVVLEPLLGQCQVLCVEIIHLSSQFLVPRLQVRDDLREDETILCYDTLQPFYSYF